MNQFAWLDLISISLICLLAIKGVANGLIRELFGLIGIVGGIYFAFNYAEDASIFIESNLFSFGNESSKYLIGFLSVLVGFWLSSIFLGAIFAKLLSLSGLGFLDKLLGFAVGGAKIFIIFSIIFTAVSHIEFINTKIKQHTQDSFMYPLFIQTGSFIINIKTDDLPSVISDKQSQQIIKEATNNNSNMIKIESSVMKNDQNITENNTSDLNQSIQTNENIEG